MFQQYIMITLVLYSLYMMNDARDSVWARSQSSDDENLKNFTFTRKQSMAMVGALICGALMGYGFYEVLMCMLFSFNIVLTAPWLNIALLAFIVVCAMVKQLSLTYELMYTHAFYQDQKKTTNHMVCYAFCMFVALLFNVRVELSFLIVMVTSASMAPLYCVLVFIHQFNIWYDVYRMQARHDNRFDCYVLYGKNTQLLVNVMRQSIRSYVDFLLLGLIVEFAPIPFIIRVVASACTFTHRFFIDEMTIRAAQSELCRIDDNAKDPIHSSFIYNAVEGVSSFIVSYLPIIGENELGDAAQLHND